MDFVEYSFRTGEVVAGIPVTFREFVLTQSRKSLIGFPDTFERRLQAIEDTANDFMEALNNFM